MGRFRIQFLGAVGTVTGSCTLIRYWENNNMDGEPHLILVDAGLYQGEGVEPREGFDILKKIAPNIERIFITHAHIDHIGLLPDLYRWGFCGLIQCTKATKELIYPMLMDAMQIAGNSSEECKEMLHRFRYYVFDEQRSYSWGQKAFFVAKDLVVWINNSAHIIGSCSYTFSWVVNEYKSQEDEKQYCMACFSGDVGGTDDEHPQGMVTKSFHMPRHSKENRYIIMESTYGARVRDKTDIFTRRTEELRKIINDTKDRGGRTLIPVFSLNRAQDVLLDLYYIKATNFTNERYAPLTYVGSIGDKTDEAAPDKDKANKKNKAVKIKKGKRLWDLFLCIENEDGKREKFLRELVTPALEAIGKPLEDKMIYDESPLFDTPLATFPQEVSKKMVDFVNENLAYRVKRIEVQVASPLIGLVNKVFLDNFTDSAMGKDGAIHTKYLPDIFLEKLSKFKYERTPDTPALDSEDFDRYVKKVKGWLSAAQKILESILKPFDKNESFKPFVLMDKTNVIVSSSGMCDSGAILQILPMIAGDEKNTIILTGYQAQGTNGQALRDLEGMTTFDKYNTRLNGLTKGGNPMTFMDVKCKIYNLASWYSGHADAEQLSTYVHGDKDHENIYPTTVFLNHGNDDARNALKDRLSADNARLGHKVDVILPSLCSEYELTADGAIPIDCACKEKD